MIKGGHFCFRRYLYRDIYSYGFTLGFSDLSSLWVFLIPTFQLEFLALFCNILKFRSPLYLISFLSHPVLFTMFFPKIILSLVFPLNVIWLDCTCFARFWDLGQLFIWSYSYPILFYVCNLNSLINEQTRINEYGGRIFYIHKNENTVEIFLIYNVKNWK